jgi:sugar O-acyltransferase (sialic acid O-acetyltransferase NeuD family)
MLVIGAKGFAIQLFDVINQLKLNEKLTFYDDISLETVPLFGKYEILKNTSQAMEFLRKDNRFCLGIGNSKLRELFFKRFETLGGECQTIISPFAHIGSENVTIGKGSTILTNSVIESTSTIGIGTLINIAVTITHNNIIGDFCEFSPGVHISGNCIIGNNCSFGSGSVVLPKIVIGDNVIVGAGAVVTKNILSNSVVAGIPAKKIINI